MIACTVCGAMVVAWRGAKGARGGGGRRPGAGLRVIGAGAALGAGHPACRARQSPVSCERLWWWEHQSVVTVGAVMQQSAVSWVLTWWLVHHWFEAGGVAARCWVGGRGVARVAGGW